MRRYVKATALLHNDVGEHDPKHKLDDLREQRSGYAASRMSTLSMAPCMSALVAVVSGEEHGLCAEVMLELHLKPHGVSLLLRERQVLVHAEGTRTHHDPSRAGPAIAAMSP